MHQDPLRCADVDGVSTRASRLLQLGGTVAWLVAAAWFHATTLAAPPYGAFSTSRFAWTCAFGVLLVFATYAAGLPDATRTRRVATAAAMLAYGASLLAISAAQLVLGQALLPRAVAFGAALVVVPWNVLCSGLAIDRRARSLARDRVVVVGSWADAAELSEELDLGAERPAVIVAALGPDEAVATTSGTLPLVEVATTEAATVVVLDRVAQLERSIVEQTALLHGRGIRVRTLSLFYEEWLGKLPLAELERISLMFDIGEIHRIRYGRIKRVVDVCVGLVGTVALVPVVALVAVGNLIANRGPLLYRQTRIGKNGTPFTMLKFRSMRPSGDSSEWTARHDPRITPFGSFLRRSHLDELPQMVNILLGDLSIVGPRPEQPAYVDELSEKLPYYPLRHLVRPGLTGWAQVKYGYASSEADALQKLQYEFYYLRHQRLSFDLRVIVRTVRSVVRGGGR